MIRRSKNGNLVHGKRDVSTRRPMHVTQHIGAGLPSLRRPEVLALFRRMVGGAAERGLKTVAYALVGNHIHWVCLPESREALAAATRYVFGQLARNLNRLWQRKGHVFEGRFASETGRSARQAWNTLNYVLRNPVDARLAPRNGRLDPYIGANVSLLATHPFLRSVFGPVGPQLRQLLHQMARAPVPFTPLLERLQPALPL
jgi:putative transposase